MSLLKVIQVCFHIDKFLCPADDEVLIIKSVTHKDFNAMIKVKIASKEADNFIFSLYIVNLTHSLLESLD